MIIFFLITWETSINIGFAQVSSFYLTPWIQEMGLPVPYPEVSSESLFLDHQGHLFLGRENGLSIIEGNRASHILVKGPVYVTSNNSDTLFYTSAGDVGYLVKKEGKEYEMQSRNHWIPASQRNFVPRGILFYRDVLFILSDRGIYSFRNGSFRLQDPGAGSLRFRIVDEQLFLLLENGSVKVWDGMEFSVPKELPLQRIDPLRDLNSLFPELGSLTFIDTLSDGILLANSSEKGLFICDAEGQMINILGSKGGLPDREIRQVLVSEGREIWILGPHSLHKISYPSPLKMLDFGSFETGRILQSLLIGDTLYAGTSHGLFRITRPSMKNDRVLVESLLTGNPESIHLLTHSGARVFAAGISHLYAIDGQGPTLLAEGNFTGLLALDNNRIVAANQNGIFLYSQTDHGWLASAVDRSHPTSTSFVLLDDRLLYLYQNGIYGMDLEQFQAVPVMFHTKEMLLRMFPIGKTLYLLSGKKVYRYDRNENTFFSFSSDPESETIAGSDAIVPGPSGWIWLLRHEGKYRSSVSQLPGIDADAESMTNYPVLGNLGEILNLHIKDSTLFLTGKDKVSIFDLRYVQQQSEVQQVSIEESEVRGNDFHFRIAGLEFQSAPEPLFRTRLLPHQNRWSDWSPSRERDYYRLKHGNNTLEIQAIDLYGRKSAVSTYPFFIRPPVYTTWYAYVLYGILLLIVLFLLRKWRFLSYQRAESLISQRMQSKIDQMAMEKAMSDKLASEFLPDKTAAQLKSAGKAKFEKYERATVLFSDIQGFTKIAEEMNPEALIDELDKFFFHFDSVVEKYNIEKIKTIGDAYMAAGGIPEKNSTNPVEVVMAALEMQSYMAQLKVSRANIWDLRIGIHTGAVIAGVVGHKKVSYDIWGDTVNTASRMESSGMPGKVNISGITYGMVKDFFLCEYRGKLPVKYKGNIDMYFVKGLRPELSVDLKEIPNKRFFIKLQLLRLADIEERVFEVILKTLPESLYFHTVEYARKVYNQSYLLCRAEELEEEERLLVRTATLLLFTGLTQTYNNFENRSMVIARDILPLFTFSESQIDRICNLILSTKMPFEPNNHLEKIMIDSRMEYIGRPDFTQHIKLLYQELREAGVKINGQQFKNQQLELLYEFDYFTLSAKRLREVSGPKQMANLEQERWI